MKNWHVYLVLCSDGTLYCGISTCVESRVKAHNGEWADNRAGAKYTSGRRPVTLVAKSGPMSHCMAATWEARIKRLPKGRKVDAIQSLM